MRIVNCDFVLPKNPVSSIAQVPRVGVSLEQCVDNMEAFKWELGMFCPSSHFCGLGIDLSVRYDMRLAQEFEPLWETCFMLTDEEQFSCQAVRSLLYESTLLRVAEKTCLSHGLDFCAEHHLNGCEDVEGGSVCKGCLEGAEVASDLVKDPMEMNCKDIDECAAEICGEPDRVVLCENKFLTYYCQCQEGFQFNSLYGSKCEDIDECEGNSDICGTYNVPAAGNEPAASVSRGQCVNTEGSFVCDCAEGFQFQSDSHPKCQDYDECADENMCGGVEMGTCINTEPNYTCECKEGTELQIVSAVEQTCADLDECEESNPCGSHGTCSNTVFPYSCTCEDRYEVTLRHNEYGTACTKYTPCYTSTLIQYCGTDPNVYCKWNSAAHPVTCACNYPLTYSPQTNKCDDI
ncbi:latent-transforming growth factor beta-binding protein 2-like isoform X2 [Symsagittifera roscoffensis]